MRTKFKNLSPVEILQLEEETFDVFLEVREIRRGNKFYEHSRGYNYEFKALTSARRIGTGWYCIAENKKKQKVEFYASDESEHPGPNLYWEPQYTIRY